jgi:hypothetical protein
MKNHFLYFLAFTCISIAACSDKESNLCAGKTEAISIKVEGVAMSNITGTAYVTADEISVDINGDSANDASVFFSCPKTEGTIDLKLGAESQTITAFVPADVLNIFLTTGCFEIVSITDSKIVMRFNVNEDDTSINGEITLDVQ